MTVHTALTMEIVSLLKEAISVNVTDSILEMSASSKVQLIYTAVIMCEHKVSLCK